MRKVSWLVLLAVALGGCLPAAPATPFLVTLTPTAEAHIAPTDTSAALETATDTVQPPSNTPAPSATEPSQTPKPSNTPVPPKPTDTPLPPTPTVDPWPAVRSGLAASKIGLHVILNDDPRIMEFIKRTKPRVIKGLDNLDWMAMVKQVSPQTVTLGRFTNVPNRDAIDNPDPGTWPNPSDFAHNFIDTFVAQYRQFPGVDYWEGWNEFLPHGEAQWKWFADFEGYRACYMNDLGLKAAIGGFSAGTPEYPDMAYFVPALQKAAKCNAIFTLHEYSSPTLQTGFNSGIPNAVHVNDAGSLTMRYRYWYEGYIKPRGFTIPLVISEAGIDSNVGPGCPLKDGGQGWYSCYKDWDALNLGPEKWKVYLDQLAWYDNLLRQDDYVIGITLFTAGTSKVDAWRTFGIDDLLIPLAVYENGQ